MFAEMAEELIYVDVSELSQTVKDLVAGSGFGFIDRGEHELKGIPGIWRVHAVAEG